MTSPPPPVLGEYLTTRQLSALLQIKPQTLRKWRTHGGGPAYYRLGNSPKARVLYAKNDVLEWLGTRKHRHTAEEETNPNGL